MSIECGLPTVWQLLTWAFKLIKDPVKYAWSSEDYAKGLRDEVDNLEKEYRTVQDLAQVAKNNLRILNDSFTGWRDKADQALKDARKLLDDFDPASKTCCYGTLPDPYCRYQFSTKAEAEIKAVREIAQNCSRFDALDKICLICRGPADPTPARKEGKDAIPSTSRTASLFSASTFESRVLMIQKIMEALASKSNSAVGVFGMGGVGKSFLLDEVEQMLREKKSFDWVARADVSKNPDIKTIQEEIANGLEFTDMKKEETTNERAKLLRQRLENEERNNKKVLIILDNLYKGLDLKSIGIPCGPDNKVKGCQLLLTSRHRDVLRVEMGCDVAFPLGELKEKEAKSLFKRIGGDRVHKDDLEALVDKVLDKCAGVPFLIVAMAKRFKVASEPQWKDTVKKIEKNKYKNINDLRDDMLLWSYEELEEEEKRLLWLCVVYGVSKPSLQNLVNYGFGLGIFEGVDSMEEARNRLSSHICTLQASSLLLDSEDVASIKIHDLVHEFVVSKASSDHPLLVLKDNNKGEIELPEEKLRSCTAVCFPHVDIKELPEELNCPEMQIFLLFPNNEPLKVPDSYFNYMRKLMVLHLSQVHLTRLHSPFQSLEKLHTLCLDGCSLENVAVIGELKGLHILSFVNSKIERLPKEIGQLIELRLPDLNHCSRLETIDPGVLQSLINLEELYMENSFDQWNAVGQTPPTNAGLIELNNMKNLCTLYASIPNLSMLPEYLNVEKLTKYKIQIGDVQRQSYFEGLSTLEFKLDPTTSIHQKGCIQTLLGKTDDLYFDGLNGVEQSICMLSQEGFPNLKHLHVNNSPSLHYILQSPSQIDFKTMESLLLENLINLEKICNNHISSMSLIALKVVRVNRCNRMEVLCPLSLLRELPQLEEIQIVGCQLMREIVEVDDCSRVELRNLHVLKLLGLPNTKNFSTAGTAPSSSTSNDQVDTRVAFFNGQQVSIPSLESLMMDGLPNLKDIFAEESPVGLSNLQFLQVSSCKSLSTVINSTSLVKLPNLQTLTVGSCDSVQEIFCLDKLGAGVNVETLTKLNTINIWELRSLRHIWSKNPCEIMKFQNFKELEVHSCDNLEFLFFPSMVQSLVQLRKLEVWNCKKMKAVIMEEEGSGKETPETLVFSMLTNLSIYNLESLTCFSCTKCSRVAQGEDRVKSCSTTLFNQEIAFPGLETLYISRMDKIEILWDNQVAAESFHKLKSLSVDSCEKLVNIIPSCILGRLRSLESLEVRSCHSLEVVFKLQPLCPPDGDPVYFMLKKLNLYALPDLKCVWDKEFHSRVKFQCLHSVTISGCESLTALFPTSIAVQLTHLEELRIYMCGIVEVIEKDEFVLGAVFPRLTFLKLKRLTKLKCTYIGRHALLWPALRTLEMDGCDKVEILASQSENDMPFHRQPFFLIKKGAFQNLQELKLDLSGGMEMWHGHFHDGEFFCKLRVLKLHHLSKESAISTCHFVQNLPNLEELVVCESYLEKLSTVMGAIEGLSPEGKVILPLSRFSQHLKTLDVSCCDELSNMFTPTIAGNLVELTKLKIRNCKMLTEVICNGGGEEGFVVAFNQLKYMELDGLTKLRCFSSIKYTMKFPLLEDVIVSRCPNMKFFSEGLIEAPKLERVQVSTETWFWKENLDTTIRSMFEERAVMSQVKSMRLSEFPELIGKWHGKLSPIKSSWQLKSLMVDKCTSFINVIPSRLMLLLKNMERLQVRDCESLEEIFDLEGLGVVRSSQVLPSFMHLDLVNLPKLRRLWNKDLQGSMAYNCLRYLTLYNCSNLRHAFAPSMARCLANLWEIEIKECGQMEGVIAEEESQGSVVEKIIFPNLWRIGLECLPNLTSLLSGNNRTLECPELRWLTIAHCPKMRSLTVQSLLEIDHSSPPLFTPQVHFPQLGEIVLSHMDNLSKIWTTSPRDTLTFEYLHKMNIKNCKSLENLFPHWVATSLIRLEKLRVESCGLEEIVASGDDNTHSTTAQIVFPELTSLVFNDMPQLKSFCTKLPPSNWPFLKKLRVTHCDKLSMLSFVASMNKWTQKDDQHHFSDYEAPFLFEMDIPTLERLSLVDKDIWRIHDGNFPDDIFGKLQALTLACFHDENAVFPSRFLPQRFRNLQSLEVFCSSFEDIFPNEELVDEGNHMVFKNLKELKLSKLHNLKRVWREDFLVSKILQSIESFEVWDCPSLTTLFPTVTIFQNLTKLVVKNSFGLEILITASAITNLVHLTDMTIIGCAMMKEVVKDDVKEGRVISFEKLERLTLQQLPSLECFSSTTICTFKFPSLWNIKVEDCLKMKIFSKGTLSTPNLLYVSLFKYKWVWDWEDRDLNATIQELLAQRKRTYKIASPVTDEGKGRHC